MLGLFDKFMPRFVKQYLDMGSMITKAFEEYRDDVKEARFPEEKHTFR
jgi:3-methyl-2-oxobutanoate hydroxymethyltransferase